MWERNKTPGIVVGESFEFGLHVSDPMGILTSLFISSRF
jgi:hypothetical protein